MPDHTSKPDMTRSDPPGAIPEDDAALLSQCRVETFRAGGKGGQHQNTTDSGVRLVHRPTGMRAESRTERSQLMNRRRALARLREKLDALTRRPAERVPTTPPPASRRRRLEEKRRRARLKKTRRPPGPEDD
ncbi:MAG: peptide chain release factor-like protein [Longimicrobiales bacterium]|nr:peptide chain release factor-like protein [Longimicrobiales bacterium]